MGFQLLQGPAREPVAVADLQSQCRLSDEQVTEESSALSRYLVAAREWCEAFTRRKFITQKWRMYLDAFPGYIDQRLGGNIVTAPIAIGATSYMAGIRWAIVPPWPPVQSIDALCYLGPNGDTITMVENTDYLVDKVSNPARAMPFFGKFWPIARIQANAVWLDFTTGYDDHSQSPIPLVPTSICQAILLLAAHWYDQRAGFSELTLKPIPAGIEALLYPFRDLRM
jgi:hypothetical protein